MVQGGQRAEPDPKGAALIKGTFEGERLRNGGAFCVLDVGLIPGRKQQLKTTAAGMYSAPIRFLFHGIWVIGGSWILPPIS
jgi:hypothetical protein